MLKTIAVLKEIKRRKNETKERIKKQQAELQDLLPFNASMAQTLKEGNMLLDKIPDIAYFTIKTDPSSESIVNNYINNELKDYVVKKHEENGLLFDLRYQELDI